MVVIGWFKEESEESIVEENSNARADMMDKAMCPPVVGGRAWVLNKGV